MSTFTPFANRALSRQEPYSRPTQEIADQICIGKRHSSLDSVDVILAKEDPANHAQSRNRNSF